LNATTGPWGRALALLTLLAGPAFAGDAGAYVQVGKVKFGRCPIALDVGAPFRAPAGWTVTPQQAVEAAASAGWARCNDIFEQVLYADSKNYYIAKSIFGPMSGLVRAVVIDGTTGAVSVQNRP